MNAGGVVKAAPQVITIDPIGTLVRRAGPEGLLYRDALLAATGLMLPRPDIFQGVYEQAYAAAGPRFGTNSEGAEAWWKKVTKATYDGVLTAEPVVYDADELALYESAFDDIFRSLHDDLTLSDEAWVVDPDAPRLLSALRQWRDYGGPRIVAATDHFDDRLEQLLANLLGGDCVAATFDRRCSNKRALPDSASKIAFALRHKTRPLGIAEVVAVARGSGVG